MLINFLCNTVFRTSWKGCFFVYQIILTKIVCLSFSLRPMQYLEEDIFWNSPFRRESTQPSATVKTVIQTCIVCYWEAGSLVLGVTRSYDTNRDDYSKKNTLCGARYTLCLDDLIYFVVVSIICFSTTTTKQK